MTDTDKPKPKGTPRATARALARLGAVQALYQMDIASTPFDDVMDEFLECRLGRSEEGERLGEADFRHFKDVVEGVIREQRDLDSQIAEGLTLGWTFPRLDATLRAVLRAGVYELRRCKDVPARVVINEYVELAHGFFGEEEPRVVNGVLDRLAKQLRAAEFDPENRSDKPQKRGGQ